MDIEKIITILGSLLTLFLLPMIIDYIKRRWDYSTKIMNAKFDILFELNSMIWDYHAITGRIIQLSAFIEKSTPSESEIMELIKRFSEASDTLYSGLFSCRSKIHQYIGRNIGIDARIEDIKNWTFHGEQCPDNYFLLLLHAIKRKDKRLVKSNKVNLLKTYSSEDYREKADGILQALAKQILEMNSIWYPIKKIFQKNT